MDVGDGSPEALKREEAQMFRLPSLILSAALLLAPMTASAGSYFDDRFENQQDRIAHGIDSGRLTPREATRLEHHETWLSNTYARDLSDGRFTPRALLILPYLVAFRIAIELIRWWRDPDAPSLVSPGLWIGGRVEARAFPPGITDVVDLVAEYPAPRWLRALPGYRNLPILDGAEPPSREAFLDVVSDLRDVSGDVLVHCDSGRGRAPTMAAALLIARGLAPDVESALALVRAGRPVSSPTGVDVAFLRSVLPRLRALQPAPASDEIGRRTSGGT